MTVTLVDLGGSLDREALAPEQSRGLRGCADPSGRMGLRRIRKEDWLLFGARGGVREGEEGRCKVGSRRVPRPLGVLGCEAAGDLVQCFASSREVVTANSSTLDIFA